MQDLPEIMPAEGLHVLHLLYRIEASQWEALDGPGRIAAKTALAGLVSEIRATPGTQLLTLSIVTPKADLGFMLVTRDLQVADGFAKRLGSALGPDMLTPVFSWLSLTERSEYTTTAEEHAVVLRDEEGLQPGSAEYDERLEAFTKRMEKYTRDRLEPNLPDWPVVCLYPMSKRRSPGQNWYALDHAARKKLMAGHARVGRGYAGRILQLITGSTGLDDGEWFVTLFSRSTSDIKAIVHEMRFDEVSVQYAEFGEFFIGIQMPLDALYGRLGL
jgi:hydrogen peroxide-dependent heme synthase